MKYSNMKRTLSVLATLAIGSSAHAQAVLTVSDDVAGIYNVLYRYLFDRHRDLTLPTSFLIDAQGDIVGDQAHQFVARRRALCRSGARQETEAGQGSVGPARLRGKARFHPDQGAGPERALSAPAGRLPSSLLDAPSPATAQDLAFGVPGQAHCAERGSAPEAAQPLLPGLTGLEL